MVSSVDTWIALFQKLDTVKRMLVTEAVKLVKLILAMPATNGGRKRSFSSLKRIKTYLRLTITNNQLNHLSILHTRKLSTNRIDLTKVADEFVEKGEGRKSKFGL